MSAAEIGMLARGERVSRNSSTCTAFMMLSENMTATAYIQLFVLVESTLPMSVELSEEKKGDGFRNGNQIKVKIRTSKLLSVNCWPISACSRMKVLRVEWMLRRGAGYPSTIERVSLTVIDSATFLTSSCSGVLMDSGSLQITSANVRGDPSSLG